MWSILSINMQQSRYRPEQKEKWSCGAVAAKASAGPTQSSAPGETL